MENPKQDHFYKHLQDWHEAENIFPTHLPIKPVRQQLYVISVVSNPIRFRSRYRLYREFEKYIEDSGAILYTIELALGEREFEVTSECNPRHIRVRSESEIWAKECLVNIATARLPHDWKYMAWIDADIKFVRHDWVQETVHLLQRYDLIQMFTKAIDLCPEHNPIGGFHDGFVYSYQNKLNRDRPGYHVWHPGFCWAIRRSAFNHLGGLIDWAILGSGDRHMALALIGQVDLSFYPNLNRNYKALCNEWQNRAERHIKRNIGYMEGLIYHYWHGRKADRGYGDRWRTITDENFDPHKDLKKDWQGLWQLTDRNYKLRDKIRRYMESRNEDDLYTGNS